MGDRVRRVRRYLKLNQAEFAQLVGASRERVGLWETGTRQVPLKDATRIARILREWHSIDADWLLGVTGGPAGTEPPVGHSTTDERITGLDGVTAHNSACAPAPVIPLRTLSDAA